MPINIKPIKTLPEARRRGRPTSADQLAIKAVLEGGKPAFVAETDEKKRNSIQSQVRAVAKDLGVTVTVRLRDGGTEEAAGVYFQVGEKVKANA